jgi:hypothetical protein
MPRPLKKIPDLPEDGNELYAGFAVLALNLYTGEILLVPKSKIEDIEAAVIGGFARSWIVVGMESRKDAQRLIARVAPSLDAAMTGVRTDDDATVLMTSDAMSHFREVSHFLIRCAASRVSGVAPNAADKHRWYPTIGRTTSGSRVCPSRCY